MNMVKEKMNISEVIDKVSNFGTGTFLSTAYDTAWVALIPDSNDNTKPAFEKSLEWLRQNQLSDGSWGTEYPKNSYHNILCTLSAIVCFKKWNKKSDQSFVESGIKAFKYLIQNLDDLRYKVLAFDPIVPTLIDMVFKYGIDLNNEVIFEIRQRKAKKLYKFCHGQSTFKNMVEEHPHFTIFIEGYGSYLNEEELRHFVRKSGIVGTTYSTTAFALLTDPTLETSYKAIKNVVDNSNGGIPAFTPNEVFGLVWSLVYIFKCGLDLKDEKYEKWLDTLEGYWTTSGKHLGGSLEFEKDVDDTSLSLFVLNSAGRQIDVNNCQNILKHFRTDHFQTYSYEVIPSLTTNLHCLLALNNYKGIDDTITSCIEKTLHWIKREFEINSSFLFKDKWHISSVYPLSRAVLALNQIDKELTKKCVQHIIDMQRKDGGWGYQSKSTLEETGLAVLALYFWFRNNPKENLKLIIDSIKRGKLFMETTEDTTLYPLWIAKTLYCVTDVVQTIIYCARAIEI